ncbi:MAG: hypothetical protein ACYC3I_09735 [Gemmataceae bacterium]
MIINVSKIVSPDLFVENESLMLDRHRAMQYVNTIPSLSAVTFVATKSVASFDLDELAIACGNEAMALAANVIDESYHVWLFVSDGPWRPTTPVARYKKLWKDHLDLVNSPGVLRIGEEVEIESGGLIRFAGLLEVSGKAFDKAIRLARTNSACAIILSSRSNIDSKTCVRSIFLSAFPETSGIQQTSVDWMTLAIDLCPKGDLLIRVSGLFDDPVAAVDVIAAGGIISTT